MAFRGPLCAALLLAGAMPALARAQATPEPAPAPRPGAARAFTFRMPAMRFSYRMPARAFPMRAWAWSGLRGDHLGALSMASRAHARAFAWRSRAMGRGGWRLDRIPAPTGRMALRRPWIARRRIVTI
jgi:hypothetical protein